MYLVDTNGTVYTDEAEVSENIMRPLASPANDYSRLVLDERYSLLYRYDVRGDLDLFFVGEKPFQKLHITLYELHVFQDHGELIKDECRIQPRGDKEVTVYAGGKLYVMPLELMTKW